jgi:hypothetical protein
MKIDLRTLIHTLMLCSFLSPSPLLAYRGIGYIWSLGNGQSIEYVVNRQLSADLSDADALAAINDGFNVWNEVTCSYMRWSYAGRTDLSGWGEDDGANVVTWRENSWDDSAIALGITSTIFNFNGLIDTDIKYNGYHHQWGVLRSSGTSRLTDIGSVTVHESGHALGLDHSDVPTATMWPSALEGDISTRSLDQDDIDGVCSLYPSGQAPPMVNPDPMTNPGSADFGEDCFSVNCRSPYFCISDSQDQYCTQDCDQQNPCPNGYYCAQLSSGSGACAEGEAPTTEISEFGEPCGQNVGCAQGLFCISDGENGSYCSGPCQDSQCPDGYRCAGLQGGGDVCAKGVAESLPTLGQPCLENGACDDGLFCLTDQLFTDPNTGMVVPYCSQSCGAGCPNGYRCVEVGNEDACQKIPSAPDQKLGDPCWINPENPSARPSCVEGLICVQSKFDSAENRYVEPGICTKNCNPDDCCPIGWGCLGLTPLIAQCVFEKEDDPLSACATEKQPIESMIPTDENPENGISLKSSSKDDGCQTTHTHALFLYFMVLFVLMFKPKQKINKKDRE